MNVGAHYRTPFVDLWAPVLELILMVKIKRRLQLSSLLSAFAKLDFSGLFWYFLTANTFFLLSIAAMLYLALNWTGAFVLVSYVLLIGAFVHFGIAEMGLDHTYILPYIAFFGIACGASLLFLNKCLLEAKKRSLTESARAIRSKAFDVSIALAVSVSTIFSFLVLYSHVADARLDPGEALLVGYLKIAALCSLIYKFRFTMVILMTASSAGTLVSYVRMIARRIKFIGTICLAGMVKPVVLAMCILRGLFNCIVLLDVNICDHTLTFYELGTFHSAMNNVSLLEGQRAVGCRDNRKPAVSISSFSFFPGIFCPSFVAMAYIFSVLMDGHTSIFDRFIAGLHLAVLYLLFMELLYSIVVVRTLLEREKREDAILNAIVVNDKREGEGCPECVP
jgi:hypothetical protein